MHKKLIMACMAIAAFAAFVIAPAASASPVLTSGGVAVPVGTKIIATNVGETIFTGTDGTVVKCDHVTLTGPVTKNSGTKIEGEMTTADFKGTAANTECTSSLGASVLVTVPKLCLTVSALPADEVVTTGCAGANVTFTLNFTNLFTCTYSRASIGAKFTTGTGHLITINNNEETLRIDPSSPFCPDGGYLDMSFETWTDTGVAHTTANALTIS